MKGEGNGEAEAKCCIRCVCVCVKCTVFEILRSSALVWPNFPNVAKEEIMMLRMKVGIKEILLQCELNYYYY